MRSAAQGGDRLWDLAARVYPDDPLILAAEALRIRDQRRLRALCIARGRGPECPVEPADVGQADEPAVVEGVKGTWRVDPAQLAQPFWGRAALLSPFDRLVHDRKRILELFEFDYQLEMHKPAASRRWGYYALPVLYGGRLVGKLDASADRPSRGAAGPRDPPGRPLHHGHDRGRRPRDRGPGRWLALDLTTSRPSRRSRSLIIRGAWISGTGRCPRRPPVPSHRPPGSPSSPVCRRRYRVTP